MRIDSRRPISALLTGGLFSLVSVLSAAAQGAGPQDRLARAIAPSEVRAAIPHTVNRKALAAVDGGALAGDRRLEDVTLRFGMTTAQSTALDRLLADQANPQSPRYRQWLTPESYAAQFGLSAADIATVSAWLQSQGLTVTSVARGRSFLTVSGTVAQVNHAFGTEIHSVTLNGERHFSNLSEPQLPASIAAIVTNITGLNDFRLKARVRRLANPKYNYSPGNIFLAPGDINTIYDLNPLLAESINGTGITIAVAGRTDISLADIAAFRAAAGLPANAPTIQLAGTTDPGVVSGEVPEASLDVEWSGAIAPNAHILYVNGVDVFDNSVTQAIDQNLAPIITVSYGDCEAGFTLAGMLSYNQLFKQANAQGQTVVGPAGDNGSTDCDYTVPGTPAITAATQGLAVDYPASSPYVTGVGGTMLNPAGGNYFSTTNGPGAGSALSYIPEAVWNETAVSGVNGGPGQLTGGGGGQSLYFSKPAYQSGPGVPNDFSRDVPDVSLDAASNSYPYLICAQGSCVNGFRDININPYLVGGTSVSTPEFAGILALIEQKINARIGNANPVLYALGSSTTYAPSVFHDITVGGNQQPCVPGTPDCLTSNLIGFGATQGYDLASGWGTIDALNLVNDWTLVTPTGITNPPAGTTPSVTTLTAPGNTFAQGTSLTLTAQVAQAPTPGGPVQLPTGAVQLLIDGVPQGAAVPLSNGSGALNFAIPATLAAGGHTASASYSGDTVFAGSKGSVLIDVVSATLADFTLTPANATITVASGATAPGQLFTITSVNGFSGPVALTVAANSSNPAATVSFSVDPVNVAAGTPGTTTLTVFASVTQANKRTGTAIASAPASSGSALLNRLAAIGGSGLAFAALLGLFIPGGGRQRRRGLPVLAAILLAVSIAGLSGCSSNGVSAAPVTTNAAPGTYALTVTGTYTNPSTGAVISHSVPLTLVVQ